MNNIYEDITNKLFDAKSGFVAIRHYNNFYISEEDIEETRVKREDTILLYESFTEETISGPFDPFLKWIKELCDSNGLTYAELLDDCDTYLLHRQLFESYFTDGMSARIENPLINEIKFERQLFTQEVIAMLSYFSNIKPICIVLENLSVAGYSTLVVIKNLMKKKPNNISVICTYNEIENEVEYTKEVWDSIVEEWEARNQLLDILGEEDNTLTKSTGGFVYENDKLEEYYTNLINLYNFMAYKQASHYLNVIYIKFQMENILVSAETKFKFLELYAVTAMYMEQGAEALMYLNTMQPLLNELPENIWKIRYNIAAARIYMYGYQQDMSRKYINRCKELMVEENKPFLNFKINLLEHMNFFQGWRSIWMLNVTINGLDDLIADCIKYNYDNHLAHIYVYAFDNEEDRYSNLANLNVKMPHFLKGMKLAKKIGNYNFMIEAYKKNVLLASTNGYYNTANYFNEKVRDICIQHDTKIELANTYNGMGYTCCVTEDYQKADEHYNNALDIFMSENDIDSVNETIYNLAINAILAEHYKDAEKLFQICIKGIDCISANSVNACNISKIYGLRAFCNFMIDQAYSAMVNLQYAEQFLGHIIELEEQDVDAPHLWDDDLAIFYTVSALIDEKNKQYEDAFENLKKGKKYVDRATGSRFLLFCPYALVYARVAERCGDLESAKSILHEARKYCRKNNFPKRLALIEEKSRGKKRQLEEYNIGLRNVTSSMILEKAEYIGMSKDYNSQKTDLDFLGIWQKILSGNASDVERVLDNAFVTLMNQYNLDDFLYIRMEAGAPVLKYKNTNSEITEEILWYIVDYFNMSRSAFKTSRRDKGYTRYQKFINNCFGFNSISTFIAVPIFNNEALDSVFLASVQMNMEWSYKSKRYIFDSDDLEVFKMLYHSVVDYIERMEAQKEIATANNRLKNMAVKDQLTGIYNRQGLVDLFEGDFHEIAIIYADLDNFKYYNDTFGHDVGDKVLVEFAKLLGKATHLDSHAVRYGGDEFLLIMYTDDKKDIEDAVKNIYKKLEETQGLAKDVEISLGYDLEIPKDKQLSCSIGIAMGTINPQMKRKTQINNILKKADTMMYRVKHTTKHSYMFYEF